MSRPRPTAADRLARGSNPPAQTASRSIASTPSARVKPVRLTVDLQPGDYDALRDWAHNHRMSHSDVLRALVRTLVTADPAGELPEQVRRGGAQ